MDVSWQRSEAVSLRWANFGHQQCVAALIRLAQTLTIATRSYYPEGRSTGWNTSPTATDVAKLVALNELQHQALNLLSRLTLLNEPIAPDEILRVLQQTAMNFHGEDDLTWALRQSSR